MSALTIGVRVHPNHRDKEYLHVRANHRDLVYLRVRANHRDLVYLRVHGFHRDLEYENGQQIRTVLVFVFGVGGIGENVATTKTTPAPRRLTLTPSATHIQHLDSAAQRRITRATAQRTRRQQQRALDVQG